MAEDFLDELVRYIRFGSEHQRVLREFHEVAAPHFERMADEFYARIREHEGAHKVFRKPGQVERLKVSLRAWFGRVLTGPWDRSYLERSARIGRIHVQVGLEQHYMFTAMNQIRDMFCAVAREHSETREHERLLRSSIDKILDAELAIMLGSYREDSMAAVRRVERVEREILAARLSMTEARYRAMLEAALVVIIAADPDGRVLLFNRKAEALTGMNRLSVSTLDAVLARLPEDDRAKLAAAIRTTLAGGDSPAVATKLLAQTGSEHWVRWHLTEIKKAAQSDICLVGVDETDEHRLGEVTRRGERLAALGTMAAGFAHEIRNPLNAAHLQALLIERRLVDSTDAGKSVREAIRVVRDELARLAVLVGDFLDFARPPSLRLTVGDLAKSAEEVVTLVQPDFDASSVSLRYRATEPVVARFDDEKIRQVLHNLLRNALEAAGEHGEVEVQALRDQNYAVLRVTDTGSGPPEEVDLFQPFETSKEGGTGLGLSIVHRICADHGGTVGFKREDGRTIFRVELPVDGIDDPAAKMAVVKERHRPYEEEEGEPA